MGVPWALEPKVGAADRPRESTARPDETVARQVDVVVLGGGPAGTAAALVLAQRGQSVTLLERSQYEAARIGETLPPEIRSPLAALGLWEQFLGGSPVASPGNVSVWGHAKPSEVDFITNPYGCGWHVDRRSFDLMLARAAREAGATLLTSARPMSFARKSSRGWRLEASVQGAPAILHARAVIDATGRSSWFARRLGVRRIADDRLIGLVAVCTAARPTSANDQRTLLEAVEGGWWYVAPLPDNRQVAAFMTDVDLLPRRRDAQLGFWENNLRLAPHAALRLGSPGGRALPRAIDAGSSRLSRAAGEGWLAIGDAAASVDPLSSQGIYRALLAGIQAAHALDGRLSSDLLSFDAYANRAEADYGDYLLMRTAYYRREYRWPSSIFWRRRHVKFIESSPYLALPLSAAGRFS